MHYTKYLIAFFFFATTLVSCKKDDDDTNDNFNCGGELVQNPQFIDSLQVELDSVVHYGAATRMFHYTSVSTSNPDYVVYAMRGTWMFTDSLTSDTATINFTIYRNNQQDSTVSPYYDALIPGAVNIIDGPTPDELGVIMLVERGGVEYYTHYGNNQASLFRIMSRSAPYDDNGQQMVTLDCVFCVRTYTESGERGPSMKGNFRCRLPI